MELDTRTSMLTLAAGTKWAAVSADDSIARSNAEASGGSGVHGGLVACVNLRARFPAEAWRVRGMRAGLGGFLVRFADCLYWDFCRKYHIRGEIKQKNKKTHDRDPHAPARVVGSDVLYELERV